MPSKIVIDCDGAVVLDCDGKVLRSCKPCNDCDPPLFETYNLALSGFTDDFAELNGQNRNAVQTPYLSCPCRWLYDIRGGGIWSYAFGYPLCLSTAWCFFLNLLFDGGEVDARGYVVSGPGTAASVACTPTGVFSVTIQRYYHHVFTSQTGTLTVT